MGVKTRVMTLMAEKQIKEGRVIRAVELERETGLTRPTILSWIKSDLRRFDEDAIVAFCKYFDCEIGDLLVLERDKTDS